MLDLPQELGPETNNRNKQTRNDENEDENHDSSHVCCLHYLPVRKEQQSS